MLRLTICIGFVIFILNIQQIEGKSTIGLNINEYE